MLALCGSPANTVSMWAADAQQEVYKFGTASVNGACEQQASVRALEGGSGRLLKVATATREQASLHLGEVWQEHRRRELVSDEWLKNVLILLLIHSLTNNDSFPHNTHTHTHSSSLVVYLQMMPN